MFMSAMAGFFVGLSLKDSWQNVKITLGQINSIILFIVIYITFMVISSTTTAYDPIGDRLLSPIYVPLTLLLLILTHAIAEPYRKRFSKKIVDSFLIIGIAIWLVYPIRATMLNTIALTQNGGGYNDKAWRESETIQYLLQHRILGSECTVYTNDPWAVYILAHLKAKRSPDKRRYNSPEIVNDIPRLKGSWPEENKACLVWFDRTHRSWLFTIDELRVIANLNLIARTGDGSIYSVTRISP